MPANAICSSHMAGKVQMLLGMLALIAACCGGQNPQQPILDALARSERLVSARPPRLAQARDAVNAILGGKHGGMDHDTFATVRESAVAWMQLSLIHI